MLTQRLQQDQGANSGTLTITAAGGNLAELLGLWEELRLRGNVTTSGTIITTPAPPRPPGT